MKFKRQMGFIDRNGRQHELFMKRTFKPLLQVFYASLGHRTETIIRQRIGFEVYQQMDAQHYTKLVALFLR